MKAQPNASIEKVIWKAAGSVENWDKYTEKTGLSTDVFDGITASQWLRHWSNEVSVELQT